MLWLPTKPMFRWSAQPLHAWGALLDEQDIVLVGLAVQHSGDVRVVHCEQMQAPQGQALQAQRDDWLAQGLRALAPRVPPRQRTLALALGGQRCREGHWEGAHDPASDPARTAKEAALAWGVDEAAVNFDYRIESDGWRLSWAACLHHDLQRWQSHARQAGWRIPVVEPARQAALRAVVRQCGDVLQPWADAPRDWRFRRDTETVRSAPDWAIFHSDPVARPMAACGAALRGLL